SERGGSGLPASQSTNSGTSRARRDSVADPYSSPKDTDQNQRVSFVLAAAVRAPLPNVPITVASATIIGGYGTSRFQMILCSLRNAPASMKPLSRVFANLR